MQWKQEKQFTFSGSACLSKNSEKAATTGVTGQPEDEDIDVGTHSSL
jgi:hypothetical protein